MWTQKAVKSAKDTLDGKNSQENNLFERVRIIMNFLCVRVVASLQGFGNDNNIRVPYNKKRLAIYKNKKMSRTFQFHRGLKENDFAFYYYYYRKRSG